MPAETPDLPLHFGLSICEEVFCCLLKSIGVLPHGTYEACAWVSSEHMGPSNGRSEGFRSSYLCYLRPLSCFNLFLPPPSRKSAVCFFFIQCALRLLLSL